MWEAISSLVLLCTCRVLHWQIKSNIVLSTCSWWISTRPMCTPLIPLSTCRAMVEQPSSSHHRAPVKQPSSNRRATVEQLSNHRATVEQVSSNCSTIAQRLLDSCSTVLEGCLIAAQRVLDGGCSMVARQVLVGISGVLWRDTICIKLTLPRVEDYLHGVEQSSEQTWPLV